MTDTSDPTRAAAAAATFRDRDIQFCTRLSRRD